MAEAVTGSNEWPKSASPSTSMSTSRQVLGIAILLVASELAGCRGAHDDTGQLTCGDEAAAALSSRHADATEPCDTKVVFGRYCLGSSADKLPKPRYANGDMLFYEEPRGVLAVTVVDRRIARVARVYDAGGCLTFHQALAALEPKYGEGKDESYFPTDAQDDEARAAAILSRKGRARRLWKESGGWTIRLTSAGPIITLEAAHDELVKRLEEVRETGSHGASAR